MTAGEATTVMAAPRTERSEQAPPHRVLWLIKGLGLGGAEQLVRMCVPRFDRDVFQVDVAYALPHKDALVPALEDHDVKVHSLGSGGRVGWVRELRRLLMEGAYDIIHTHSPVPASAARLMLARSSTLLVHTEHNVWERFRRPTRIVNAGTYGLNEIVFGVSSEVVASARRSRWASVTGLPPVEVLHHGIDEDTVERGPAARTSARDRLGLGQEEHVIGSVANFTPKKDHGTMLQGFRHLLDSGHSARLILVGTGPTQPQMETLAREIGIADRVVFTGLRDDVPKIMAAFDVFALSSMHEGLPIALLEAMSTGVPSVVTPVGGTKEMIVHGEHGLFVPCADPRRLATTFARLLDDGELRARMGAASIQAAKRFSIDGAVRRMEQVYTNLLDERPQGPQR